MQHPATNTLQLKDIHLPDTHLAWPPAMGWWFVLAGMIILLVVLYLGWKYIKQPKVKKLAFIELRRIKNNFQSQQDHSQLAQQLSVLLRQIVLQYYPRSQSASSTGEVLKQQLMSINSKRQLSEHTLQLLATAPYQKHSEFDANALLQEFEQWINGIKRRTL